MTLHERRKAELAAAQSIIDRAKSEGRNMTDAERAEVTLRLKTAGDLLDTIAREADDKSLREQIGAAMKGDDETIDDGSGDAPKIKRYRSIGEAFVKSDAYQHALTAVRSGARYSTPAIDTGLDLKALTTVGPTYPGGTQEGPFVTSAINRPVIADLFASGTLTASVLSYLIETAYTNAAATVAESGQKPASDLTLSRVDLVLSKIATFLDVPDEFLEDFAAARSYIDGRLTLFIQLAEEQQLLTGDGTPPNLRGLLSTPGIQTETGTAIADNLDALYRAITKVRTVALLEPDGVAINPVDYQALRLSKDGNDQYYGGGPFTGAYGNGGVVNDPGVWGMRTVVTPAIAAGTAVVGAWQTGGMVFRKGGIVVDSTNTDGTKFEKNISTIRAEERCALAVFRPAAFVKVTFGTT